MWMRMLCMDELWICGCECRLWILCTMNVYVWHPSVTVAATVLEQYSLYFRSLNEIPASLVCILNILRFEFQIQTLFFYSNQVV
jgi:hypothetical protein